MAERLAQRADIPASEKWDRALIFPSREAFREAMRRCDRETQTLQEQFQGHVEALASAEEADVEAMKTLFHKTEDCIRSIQQIVFYGTMERDADHGNDAESRLASTVQDWMAEQYPRLSFLRSELSKVPAPVLVTWARRLPAYAAYFESIAEQSPHILSPSEESLLGNLAPALETPETVYEALKYGDLCVEDFEADGKRYPNSFALYEQHYMHDANTEVRRAAFRSFSESLAKIRHGVGAAYYAQVRNDKLMSRLRGYDSVFDYLLSAQRVTRDMYDRQIDRIMEDFAPHMRRYAALLQEAYKLSALHYADLKLTLDPNFSATRYPNGLTPDRAKARIREALSVFGERYLSKLDHMLQEARIDFAANAGKAEVAYCASISGKGSFILTNWTGNLDALFTLAHELGHACQGYLTDATQPPLVSEMSLYQVESPSTCNELILADSLRREAQNDPRFLRWIDAMMIGHTYFHNFVTHFLEAAYQREVYRLIDKGEVLQADDFSRLYLQVLKQFWGDAIIYDDGCELTWMRQPHYYNGLYSYTYSAGLTIATQVAERIRTEGQSAAEDWLRALASGGAYKPLDYAAIAGVDIRTDAALRKTIAYVGERIDQMEALTEVLA